MDERKYIEMETVKRHIRRLIQDPWNHQAAPASWADAYEDLIDILESEPAADVRPVKRGKWKKHYGDHEAFGERPFCLYCSVCNAITVLPFNFCPNCGADMRPVTDDGQ